MEGSTSTEWSAVSRSLGEAWSSWGATGLAHTKRMVRSQVALASRHQPGVQKRLRNLSKSLSPWSRESALSPNECLKIS